MTNKMNRTNPLQVSSHRNHNSSRFGKSIQKQNWTYIEDNEHKKKGQRHRRHKKSRENRHRRDNRKRQYGSDSPSGDSREHDRYDSTSGTYSDKENRDNLDYDSSYVVTQSETDSQTPRSPRGSKERVRSRNHQRSRENRHKTSHN